MEVTGKQRGPGQFWGFWSSDGEAGGTSLGDEVRSSSGGQKLCLAQSVLS